MKKILFIMVMVIITAFIYVGCSKSDQKTKKQPKTEITENNIPDRFASTQRGTFDDIKKNYLKNVKDKIDVFNKKIETLQLKQKGAPSELQNSIEKSMEYALEKKEVLEKQFTKLENADERTFGVEKTALTTALDEADKAYDDLVSKF